MPIYKAETDGYIFDQYQQTGPDGIIWYVLDHNTYEVWWPQLPPGPDGFKGTNDDPVEYPSWLPGGPPPRIGNTNLPARRILQIPSFEYGKPVAIGSYNDPNVAAVITVATEKKAPGWLKDPRYPLITKGGAGKPTTQRPTSYGDATLAGFGSGKSPTVWIGAPFNPTALSAEQVLTFWIPIPLPNPFYFFGDQTSIEIQKQQIQFYLNGGVERALCYGYVFKDNKFLIFDSDAASNRMIANPAHVACYPEMLMHSDDMWLFGAESQESGPGHRERLCNQFIANAVHNGWTPHEMLQLFRAYAFTANRWERTDLRPAGARPGKTMPYGASKPPGWQGAWPGDWQGHLDKLQQQFPPMHPQVMEIPPACQTGPTPPAPQPPPQAIRYVCVNGGCVVSLTGTGYATQAECEQVCELPPTPPKWSCINGVCQSVAQGGQYATRKECQDAGCGQSPPIPPGPQPPIPPPTPQPPSIRYGCVNGSCQQVGLTGPYATLAECRQSGCEQPQSRWFCEGGQCIERQGTGLQGGYKTKAECVSNCAPVVRWECRDGQCISHINDGYQGGFKTRKECEDGCSQTPPPPPPPQPPNPPPPPQNAIRYGCINGQCGQTGLTGPYATLQECLAVGCGTTAILGWACTPSGNCEQVINGPYASRALCEAQCQKPQTCDPCKEITDIKRRLPPEHQPYTTSTTAICMLDRTGIVIKQDTQ